MIKLKLVVHSPLSNTRLIESWNFLKQWRIVSFDGNLKDQSWKFFSLSKARFMSKILDRVTISDYILKTKDAERILNNSWRLTKLTFKDWYIDFQGLKIKVNKKWNLEHLTRNNVSPLPPLYPLKENENFHFLLDS